jgi:hypothetical protein
LLPPPAEKLQNFFGVFLQFHIGVDTRDSINHYRDGLKLARERLGWEPPGYICPMDFPYLTPPCPRYMHQSTYRRHLARFRRYQAAYQRDSLREMLAILRR